MTPAFHTLAAASETPLLIFGDHASNVIPPRYNNLGLSGADLTRHIAHDIGTDSVIRALCRRFGGNTDLPEMERALRMAEFYTPYHGELAKAVQRLKTAHKDPLLLSVHSFTPQPLTAQTAREMDMALLVKDDTRTAERFMSGAARHMPKYDTRINEPYSAYDLNYTIDVHAQNIRHLAIEIRQDHIGTDDAAARFAAALGDILADLI